MASSCAPTRAGMLASPETEIGGGAIFLRFILNRSAAKDASDLTPNPFPSRKGNRNVELREW